MYFRLGSNIVKNESANRTLKEGEKDFFRLMDNSRIGCRFC